MREIEDRRSIRKYKSAPVGRDLVEKLINSARLAPSGNNKQPWHFIAITDGALKGKVIKACNDQTWMASAPLLIVCVADIRERVKTDAEIYVDEESPQYELKRTIRDTAIAIGHIMLEATHNGLGTCWVGWYTQKEIRPILNLPEDKYVLGVLTVGFPDENPEARPRKKLGDILHYETW
jgi:nitroreductase